MSVKRDKPKDNCRIGMFFHCKNCLSGQLEVGWTPEGIQAFCRKCKLDVIDIDFEGARHKLYETK